MAKICAQCNTANANESVFCNACGASLSDSLFVSDSKKGVRIQKEQDPVARKILSIVLIAATLLCLFTAFQYLIGEQPVKHIYSEDKEIEREFDDLKEILDYIAYFPDDSIVMTNVWDTIIMFFTDVNDLSSVATETYTYYILTILSQVCNTIAYFILTALTLIALLLTLRKSPKASVFALIAAIIGLVMIVVGFLLGYFLVVQSYNYGWGSYMVKERTVLHQTVLMLLPLLALTIPLAIMLPKKISNNENNSNEESIYIEVNE